MRWTLVGLAVLLALAAAVGWWWTRPPAAPTAELQRALHLAPPAADGAVAVAAPARTARFLARRPQAILLLAVAAGSAADALASLQPMALALGSATRGPLVLWWQGREGGVAAYLAPPSRRAFLELAARSSTPAACGNDWCAAATVPDLLPAGEGVVPAAAVGAGSLAALAQVDGRLWHVRADWHRVETTSGTVPPAPTAPADTSAVAVAEAGSLLAPLALDGMVGGPLRLATDDHQRWAVALPQLRLEGVARRLLGGPPTPSVAPVPWRGIGGGVWVVERDGTALASHPTALALLPEADPGTSLGVLRGRHAAWLVHRAASLAGRIPGLALRQRDLARAAELAQGMKAVSFRVDARGGRILLTW